MRRSSSTSWSGDAVSFTRSKKMGRNSPGLALAMRKTLHKSLHTHRLISNPMATDKLPCSLNKRTAGADGCNYLWPPDLLHPKPGGRRINHDGQDSPFKVMNKIRIALKQGF